MKKLALIVLACSYLSSYSQDPIEVTDQTIKIGGFEEKTMYYGFNAGDQIVFNFEEIKKNELKEIEILEYPSSSKFTDFKTISIQNKKIKVQSKGIYVFKFNNGNLKGRICKIHIQRIPASEETKNFNTEVEMKTFRDTTWIPKSKVIIERYDTTAEIVLDKSGEVVHVSANSHGAYSNVEFILPKYTSHWTYWVGVGDESVKGYNFAQEKLLKGSLKYFGLCNPLASLAAGGINYLIKASAVDNVSYYFHYYKTQGVSSIFHNGGDIKYSDFGIVYPKQLGIPSEGYMYINLYNDNWVDPISVNIKILAVKCIPVEKTIHYKEANVKSYQKPVMID